MPDSTVSALQPDASDHRQAVVMIVDDEPMVTTSLATLLQLETPYQILPFNNPLAALAALTDGSSPPPDLIVSDFVMPGMDGLAFLAKAKDALPEVTTVLLTGYADKESAIQAINTIGIYQYLEKPWDNEQLKQVIQNGIERSNLLSRLKAANQSLEAKVQARTAELQAVLDHSADGIVVLDAEHQVVSFNPVASHWIPTPPHLPCPVSNMLSLTQANQSLEAFLDHLGTSSLPAPSFPTALWGEQPVELSASPLPEQKGTVLVLRDIAPRLAVERLRDDFMSTLTHDLRTPLLANIQTLELMLKGACGALNDQQMAILPMLVKSNQDLLGLVNALLEVYKYEAGKQRLLFDTVNLADMASAVCDELLVLSQNKQQQLKRDYELTNLPIVADKQQLKRVLVNLLGNAIHYSPEGAQVTVRLWQDESHAHFAVEDTGRGIPQQDLGKLFQRFSQGTSKQRSSGTGLGLYLSRQIIEAHQGYIGVESTEGHGSCFYFQLPKTSTHSPH
jgi:signal transduction histidine kinase/FixJ family two-component response regulator